MSDILAELAEQNRRAAEFKKRMTREMMANTETWKAFKEENRELLAKVKYPQELISIKSAEA